MSSCLSYVLQTSARTPPRISARKTPGRFADRNLPTRHDQFHLHLLTRPAMTQQPWRKYRWKPLVKMWPFKSWWPLVEHLCWMKTWNAFSKVTPVMFVKQVTLQGCDFCWFKLKVVFCSDVCQTWSCYNTELNSECLSQELRLELPSPHDFSEQKLAVWRTSQSKRRLKKSLVFFFTPIIHISKTDQKFVTSVVLSSRRGTKKTDLFG